MEKILRKRRNDGEVFYTFKDGREIITYTETLEDIFSNYLSRVEGLFELMKEGESIHTPWIGESLIRDVKRSFGEAYDFIRKEFGEVHLEGACYNQDGIEGQHLLGVVFEKAEGDQRTKEVRHD